MRFWTTSLWPRNSDTTFWWVDKSITVAMSSSEQSMNIAMGWNWWLSGTISPTSPEEGWPGGHWEGCRTSLKVPWTWSCSVFWNGVWLGWLDNWGAESGISSDPRHDLAERKRDLSGIVSAESIGRVSEEGMVESIHESTPIVDNSNLSSDQACENWCDRRRSTNIHMGFHEACYQTKNYRRLYFQHGRNEVCSEEQDKKGYFCHWINKMSFRKVWKRHFIGQLLLVFLPMDFMFLHY